MAPALIYRASLRSAQDQHRTSAQPGHVGLEGVFRRSSRRRASAETHWKSTEAIDTVDAYQDHLTRFPHCTFARLAKARIEGLPPWGCMANNQKGDFSRTRKHPTQEEARKTALEICANDFGGSCKIISCRGNVGSRTSACNMAQKEPVTVCHGPGCQLGLTDK